MTRQVNLVYNFKFLTNICQQEKSAGVGEGQKLSSVNSKELVHDAVSSGVSVEVRQDADSTERKHQMEESTTTKEEAADEVSF